MALVPKELTVYFYAIDPAPPELSFAPATYPLKEVLGTLRKLDPAAEDYRIKEDLFGGETLCLLHEDGPELLLGAFYKDKLARALAERKGVVRELPLEEDEGIVDASYGMFFPDDVFGLVRTSVKSPGPAKISNWLSIYGAHPCLFIDLPDADTLAQLDDEPTKLQRLRLRVLRSRISTVEPYSKRVAQALRAAADVNTYTDVVGVDLASTDKEHQAAWAVSIRNEIQQLFAIIPELEEATVKISGVTRQVNLKRKRVTGSVTVQLDGTKRVGPAEAASALFEAYKSEQKSIRGAIKAWRDHEGSATGH